MAQVENYKVDDKAHIVDKSEAEVVHKYRLNHSNSMAPTSNEIYTWEPWIVFISRPTGVSFGQHVKY